MPKNNESTKLGIHASSSNYSIMTFAKVGWIWLATTQGNCKFSVVAVDYFTKWVEAEALANITTPTIQKFFWQNIICRFRYQGS
jgi:hypothetical protein